MGAQREEKKHETKNGNYSPWNSASDEQTWNGVVEATATGGIQKMFWFDFTKVTFLSEVKSCVLKFFRVSNRRIRLTNWVCDLKRAADPPIRQLTQRASSAR